MDYRDFDGCRRQTAGARTQATKPFMTNITSCRDVDSIEHKASAVFVCFWLVFPFRKGKFL